MTLFCFSTNAQHSDSIRRFGVYNAENDKYRADAYDESGVVRIPLAFLLFQIDEAYHFGFFGKYSTAGWPSSYL